MAVRMRTGRLTTKTTDPKTGARVADPDVFGRDVEGGTVSSWPEVRKMYQEGKLKKTFEGRTIPGEVKNYLEGKTNTLNDKEFDEPILSKMQDVSGGYTGLIANLREGGSRYSAMEKSFKSAGIDVSKSEGRKINYDMAEVPHSSTNKTQGVGISTDLEYIRKKSQEESKSIVTPKDELIKLPVKNTNQAIKSASVKGPKTLKYIEPEKPSDFISPSVEKKSRVKTSSFAAKTGGGDGLVKSRGGSDGLGSARFVNTENKLKNKAGYNRQEKLFKAYAGTSVLDESHIGKSASDINAYKKEMKSQRGAFRREGNLEGVAATRMEVKQARQAERFVKGKQTHFNNENYRATTGMSGEIAPDYRDSAQNAANRNTMQSKLDAISAKGKNNTSLY